MDGRNVPHPGLSAAAAGIRYQPVYHLLGNATSRKVIMGRCRSVGVRSASSLAQRRSGYVAEIHACVVRL